MLSTSKKAVREREARIRMKNEKRFNTPLNHFIRHKYGAIYNEYVELYKRMDTLHPRRRDLTRSKTFKEWQESTTTKATTACENLQGSEETLSEETAVTARLDQNIEETLGEENINENNPQADADLRQQIDAIVSELIQDEGMREIFEQPEQDDEGIELNIFDEIEHDIISFDFQVEVEQCDLYDL